MMDYDLSFTTSAESGALVPCLGPITAVGQHTDQGR